MTLEGFYLSNMSSTIYVRQTTIIRQMTIWVDSIFIRTCSAIVSLHVLMFCILSSFKYRVSKTKTEPSLLFFKLIFRSSMSFIPHTKILIYQLLKGCQKSLPTHFSLLDMLFIILFSNIPLIFTTSSPLWEAVMDITSLDN